MDLIFLVGLALLKPEKLRLPQRKEDAKLLRVKPKVEFLAFGAALESTVSRVSKVK